MTESVTPRKGGAMTRKLLTLTAVSGTTFLLACSAAFGASAPIRDAGDATAAKLALSSKRALPINVVRDAGDATAAKLRLGAKRAGKSSSLTIVRDAGDATAAKAGTHMVR
jgi:hypothetical protein